MLPKPKISVIMAVYNGMPYLKDAVKSILNQTYRNFEFIIVDDGSTDDTWNYLKNLNDRRIKLNRNKKNQGLVSSLNRALRLAKGDYVARMDADDVSLPKRLEIQLEFLLKNPDIDLCGTWVDLIDEEGRKIGEKKYPTKPDQVKNAITWYTAVIHPSYFAKSSFFKKNKGYRQNYDYAEDYDLLSRARNKFKIANVDQKLLLWRLADQRRSRANMVEMDKTELRIKIESLKRDGLSTGGILALIKKIVFTYFLPFPLKYKIATKFLKYA